MKKNTINLAIIILVFIIFNVNTLSLAQEGHYSLELLWQTNDVLKTSESVCYNPESGVLYVSCIDGNPVEKDGNGFIAQVTLSGEIKNLEWITDLNAPKGMGIYQSKLYVTDIDRVVEIGIQNSSIMKEIPVEGAKFLNDIAIDPYGNIYVSDNVTGRIHRIENETVETWIESDEIDSPNGLYYENQEILVGTKKGIFGIRISDKKFWHLVRIQVGIDGLKGIDVGNYIISDWFGKVRLVGNDEEEIMLIDTSTEGVNAADFEFIPGKNLLIVPTFSNNRIMAYQLKIN